MEGIPVYAHHVSVYDTEASMALKDVQHVDSMPMPI